MRHQPFYITTSPDGRLHLTTRKKARRLDLGTQRRPNRGMSHRTKKGA